MRIFNHRIESFFLIHHKLLVGKTVIALLIFKRFFLFLLSAPPPEISEEVKAILEDAKPKYVNGRCIKKIKARKLARLRKEHIAKGYYWPEKPMRDRRNEYIVLRTKREKRKEERYSDTQNFTLFMNITALFILKPKISLDIKM